MKSLVRVRFAPSPTGQVHIGNIRAAIFNYLFARSRKGAFLLRVEDTDLERSTPEAIDGLMEVMEWLNLMPDEEPLYQSAQRERHLAAADQLIAGGDAYRYARSPEETPAVFFRFPCDPARYESFLQEVGTVELPLFPGETLRIDSTGITYVGISRKGKADPGSCCLAGMADAVVYGAGDTQLFSLKESLPSVLAGETVFESPEAARIVFTRREVGFEDLVKGPLAKPLDSMKDLVIVRGDGSPVFHLANVCDDLTQGISHIIRGDDHVENTYRHIPLFLALGGQVPTYAHLPMIVNAQGKPYSKRDGDAFVGDFRAKGYLPEALFNYLTLLGWSPGDDREKLNRDELIASFSLERVQRSAAQMDLQKCANLNGKYLQELPDSVLFADVRDILSRTDWGGRLDEERVAKVTRLMRPRMQTYGDVLGWRYFADGAFERDPGALKRGLSKAWQREAMEKIADALEAGASLEGARAQACAALNLDDSKLNQALRVCLTGQAGGPDLQEVIALLDPADFARRIRDSLSQ